MGCLALIYQKHLTLKRKKSKQQKFRCLPKYSFAPKKCGHVGSGAELNDILRLK